MPFLIREARQDDAEAACAVLRRSISECCAEDHRGDEAVLSSWLANKTPGNLRSWFASNAYAVVAEKEGAVVGVAMLGSSGGIILNYLVPEARFKGMGKAMLGALEEEASRRGLKELELASTAAAHEFYLRNGYADTGRKSSMFGLSSPIMVRRIGVGIGPEPSLPSGL